MLKKYLTSVEWPLAAFGFSEIQEMGGFSTMKCFTTQPRYFF